METKDLFYTLALLKIDGIGDITAKKLIQHFGSAEKVLFATKKNLATVEGIGYKTINNLQNHQAALKSAEIELKYIEKDNINVLSINDGNYPLALKNCTDAPVLLFTSGNINLENPKFISIVGTRNPTHYGVGFCKELIQDLKAYNPVIVSGFAYGIDIIAHIAATENNLQTIAVLAHGLNQIYPKVHKKYITKVEENGGLMTEFWSNSSPEKENFVKRNRIVAGLSQATIVVESAQSGGSLITANLALDYNREVYALPGKTTDKYSAGCNNLIKTQRAQLITNAQDLVYFLNWESAKPKKSIQKQLFVELDATEQKVFDYLLPLERELMDIIAISCNIPVYQLSSVLLTMELKGVVRPLPGKFFELA